MIGVRAIEIVPLELTTNSKNYFDLNENDFPMCLVLGNELTGVSNDVIEIADFALEIPQYGFKHSMNVSVAYGIAVFEVVKFINRK